MLPLTENARASAKRTLLIFFAHFVQTMWRENIASMNHSIQVHRRLVNLKELRVVQIFRVWTIASHDHLHGFFEMLDLFAQSMKVEIVRDVFLVDLREELVTFKVTEPLDPAITAFAVVFVVHYSLLSVLFCR